MNTYFTRGTNIGQENPIVQDVSYLIPDTLYFTQVVGHRKYYCARWIVYLAVRQSIPSKRPQKHKKLSKFGLGGQKSWSFWVLRRTGCPEKTHFGGYLALTRLWNVSARSKSRVAIEKFRKIFFWLQFRTFGSFFLLFTDILCFDWVIDTYFYTQGTNILGRTKCNWARLQLGTN